tara:strand:+ start:96077 stop:97168 length:1092 start_codon:yes stop_codon:yes gene_type:complete
MLKTNSQINLEGRVLIIGPSSNQQGGVATHLKNLESYNAFEQADFYDLGSINTSNKGRKSSLSKIFFSLRNLRKLNKKNQYDYIMLNHSIYLGSFLKLLLSIIFIPDKKQKSIYVFFHGGRFNSSFKKILLFKPIVNQILRSASTFYFLSEEQKKSFETTWGNRHSTQIYNNYSNDDDILKKNRTNQFDFLFVGRLVKEKGIPELIEACSELKKNNYHNWKLYIIGKGPDSFVDDLKRKISKSDLTENIELLGYIDKKEIMDYYAKAKWVVLPSYAEGFPYVFIEAMKSGTPIISTKTGALNRLISPKKNGFFIEPENSVSLYETMSMVLSKNPNLSNNCYNFFKENLSRTKAELFYTNLFKN